MRRMVLCSLFGLLMGATASLHACSCFQAAPVCSEFWATPVIFHGRVLERKLIPNITEVKRPDGSTVQLRGNGVYEVRFAVEEMFRGDATTREITVKTNEQGSACGFEFKEDADYLVFTYSDGKDNALWTSHCSRTHEVTTPEDADLVLMRALPTTPETARVFGSMNMGGMYRPSAEMPTAKISLHGEVDRHASVDATGHFSFDGLPAGRYDVNVALPSGFTTTVKQSVTIVPKGCAEIYVPVRYDSHLRGRVTDAAGTPLAQLGVVVSTEDSQYPDGMRQVNLMSTDDAGEYYFDGLPPGKYYVEVNKLGPAADRPYPAVFFGGTSTVDAAAPVQMGAAATVEHVDITLPKAWEPVVVQVRVVMPNGSPAVGADVRAYDTEFRWSVTPFSAKLTDAAGTVTVYKGRSYFLVSTLNGTGGQMCGGPVRFSTDKEVPPQAVVIEHHWGNCLARLGPRYPAR